MAVTKDESFDAQTSTSSRSTSVHMNSRPHAHSVSLGVMNNSHRINRRKSSSSMGGVNIAAISAATKEVHIAEQSARVKLENGETVGRSSMTGTAPSGLGRPKSSSAKGSSALVDGPPLSSMLNDKAKMRARRASEGSRLARGERRRSNAGELKCETCGKGYKHGSCLTKHMWEHTPEWSLTSKLLISKHQQVQLLEAATVLMNMNNDATANESAIQESESSGESPAASGSSNPQEEDSSRTSTPLREDEAVYKPIPRANRPSRQDSYNSAFSRSYASTSGQSFAASAPTEASDLHYWYQSSASRARRPSTSSQSYYSGEEQADITAAAEGLVSCSLTAPRSGANQAADDIPPVPPLPAQFAHQASRPVSFTKGYQADVEMHELPERDDEDEGVFGHMER